MSMFSRLPTGGLINRDKPLEFTFNRRTMTGFEGDTLASALLANDQLLVGRSFKYHRPRGVFTAGSEEPNALVQHGRGSFAEPNTRATVLELYDGLYARSQNHRISLGFDLMGINDVFSSFLTAGFYYKTFMWPKAFWERVYEPIIRHSAGLGKLSGLPDPDTYDKGFLHCDLLIVGAGPSGLVAALTAGRAGARVIIADEDFRLGGRLNSDDEIINDLPAHEWLEQISAELASMDNVRLMPRTTIFGAYDHGIFGGLETRTDALAGINKKPRTVLWRIYSGQAIVCAGATERSIGFGNNDRPGILLAGAMRTYLSRFGVKTGSNVVVFTNNDSGWKTARSLFRSAINTTVIDTRGKDAPAGYEDLKAATVHGCIIDVKGKQRLHSVVQANGQTLSADAVAVSGGWNPNVHLTCHKQTKPVWNESISAFEPGPDLPQGMHVAGSAAGHFDLQSVLDSGCASTRQALTNLGIALPGKESFWASQESCSITPCWYVKESESRAWIDLQNDVTTKDIAQAYQEGFRDVEHLKRYTTLGMATDQGKTSSIIASALMSEYTGKPIAETGTTIFRPPYTPVPIGSLAGRSQGRHFRPVRHTPSHRWAEKRGAVFVEVGNWLRAQWYPLAGETHWRQSVDREVKATRKSAGICDVSTLGKIDCQGKDAAEFINRIYSNAFLKLAVGKVRYGLMMREDGIVYDDGTVARLADNHFVITTTTANAVLVFRQLEFARQCLWPRLDVHLISTTDGWAQFSIAGPKSRQLVAQVVDDDFDLSNEAFPFMACSELTVCSGIKARLFRISFSGELAYEIAVPARFGNSMMDTLLKTGEAFDAVPYGTEALGVMRIEKGHFAGNELTGQTTAFNLGLERMVSKKKDSIGHKLSERPGLTRIDGWRLVGFKPVDRNKELQAGAHFVAKGAVKNLANDEGWMTSVAYSPTLGYHIGLGFIKRGLERFGETVEAFDQLRGKTTEVEIVSPHFYDPEGSKQRG